MLSDGDPSGDGDVEGEEDARRERLVDACGVCGAGDGSGDPREGGWRLSAIDGPGEPNPKPVTPLVRAGDEWPDPGVGCPKPKPRGDMAAGAPNPSMFGGC